MTHLESPEDITVAGLFVYPVKSLRANAADAIDVAVTGLAQDRSWMLVDPRATPQRFITQREQPLLATLRATPLADGGLVLHRDSAAELVVAKPAAHALARVKVWSSEVVALDAGDEAANWLSAALGMKPGSVRLVKFHPEQQRLCNARYAGDTGAHTFFADGYPVLVANEASLADLNVRMNRTGDALMPMDRFRPNVVLRGLPAWDEDHIETISVGDVEFKLVKPCVRCEITTTDQNSGARLSDEPLNTLARFRNNPDLGGVTFGWNAVVARSGRIERGAVATANYRF